MPTYSRSKTEGQLTTVNQTTVYTAPASTKARIEKLTITNIDTAAAIVLTGLWLVESGGSAGDSNILEKAASISPSDGEGRAEPMESAQGHTLDAGDSIVLQAATANKLSFHLTVHEQDNT